MVPPSKHIAGHSLGNMLVSSTIADDGMAVANYFMIDAAVPVEAYDAGAPEESNMIQPDWRGTYETRLRASEWHKLFPVGDARRGLSWRGRFGALSNAYNFYSTGEQVLRNAGPGEPSAATPALSDGLLAWAKQELSKGASFLGGGGLVHSGNGGWEFNEDWYIGATPPAPMPPTSHRREPDDTASITNAELRTKPFFRPFATAELIDPVQGAAAANDLDIRALTLAEAIPANTFAAGANPIGSFLPGHNYDMPTELSTNGWPLERTSDTTIQLRGWLHGDYRAVSFFYTYKLYEKITETGQLNQ